MRIGGLMLLLILVAGAVVGMYAIAANVSTVAPVDSSGNTVSNATNMTQQNVTAIAQVAPTAGVYLGLMVAILVLAMIVVFFALGRG